MSTEYRKADCQSTKNVGGDKPVDPQSGPAGTKLGFEIQPEHAYLGHFKQERYLREGHNFVTRVAGRQMQPDVVEGLGRRTAKRAIRAGGPIGDYVAANRPVLAAKIAARAAGMTGSGVRNAAELARRDPESRFSQRKARRSGMSAPAAPYARSTGGY